MDSFGCWNSVVGDFGYIDGIAQEERISSLSEDQEYAIKVAKDFATCDGGNRHLVIGGVAGSGKSSIIPYIIHEAGGAPLTEFGGNVAVCAYTGKAVMNLKRKGMPYACTLHAFLYDTKFEDDKATGGTKIEIGRAHV